MVKLGRVAIADFEGAIGELGPRLEKLKKSGLGKLSRNDANARFPRERGGVFALGYSAEIAVPDDHLIVSRRVTQNTTDNASPAPVVNKVRRHCGALPRAVLADGGFSSITNLQRLEQHNWKAMCRFQSGLRTGCLTRTCAGAHRRMWARLRSPGGEAM